VEQADRDGAPDSRPGTRDDGDFRLRVHAPERNMTAVMRVLVTGAAGFLGSRLCESLLAGALGRVSTIVAVDTSASRVDDPRLESRVGTIADADFVGAVVDDGVEIVFHLAAVLSGQSEAEFDTGMRVNVDGTRNLLEACRRLRRPRRFVFTSTLAVYGGPLPDIVPEDAPVHPESSYGSAKAIAEILLSEYSRRAFVDGIACRLPTVAVRPGAPNSALSSFVSGIVREPLAGMESVCPVPLDTRMWICSPDVLTRNLLHAARLPTSELNGRRVVNLPGISVTPADMLDSLERHAGAAARARVRCEPDPGVMRIVCGWPGAFDVSRALQLGFAADTNVDSIVRQFIARPR
jgi:nucleoside-diphosphate-sugar epimerase